MTTVRAARFHAWGAAPIVEDVPEPKPVPDPGHVLVEISAAAVAHLDVTISSGNFGMRPELPYIGGVEGAGIILASDPADPAAPQPGTQVLLRGAGLGMKRDGTWAERVIVPTRAAMPLPRHLPLPPETAATFFVPATTAYVALHDVARLEKDEEVIVVGAAGAVGSMVVQQALAAGARVTAVVSRADRVPHIPEGATTVISSDSDTHTDSDTDTITRLTTTRPADVLIDTIGGRNLVARTRWVRPGGRAVAIGYTAGAQTELDLPSWLLDDVSLLPVNMIRRERRAREIATDLIKDLADGTLHMTVQQFPLADAARALNQLTAGHIHGRAVLIP